METEHLVKCAVCLSIRIHTILLLQAQCQTTSCMSISYICREGVLSSFYLCPCYAQIKENSEDFFPNWLAETPATPPTHCFPQIITQNHCKHHKYMIVFSLQLSDWNPRRDPFKLCIFPNLGKAIIAQSTHLQRFIAYVTLLTLSQAPIACALSSTTLLPQYMVRGFYQSLH